MIINTGTGKVAAATAARANITRQFITAAIILVLTMVSNINPAAAATLTWTGFSGRPWASSSNWEPSQSPQQGDNLIFPANPSSKITLNDLSSAIYGNITIGGSVYTFDGNSFSISGTFSLATPGSVMLYTPLTLLSGGTYKLQINGTTPGTQYGQTILAIGSAIDLGGAALDVTLDPAFTPAVGDTFTIIDNTAISPVLNTFSRLPEGAEFWIGGYLFAISYVGGDGNDVTLTRKTNTTVTAPVVAAQSASQATLTLTSGVTGVGWFTILPGSGTACGTGANVKAGKAADGTTPAFRIGSLPLTANTPASYTVRNLMQSSDYTVCFTAADVVGTPNPTPASAGFTTTAMASYPDPAWINVGNAGFSADQAYYTSLAFAPDGAPYMGYSDNANSGKTTVMKYDGSGTTGWVTVGSAGFSAGQESGFTSLAFAPDGTPYLAYQDVVSVTNKKATVMKYNGSAWVNVGSAGFSAGQADYTSLAFAPDGTPYLAYQDYGNGYKATVMKYNGSAWVSVGTPGFSAGTADFTSLAFAPDGTPYLAYQDYGNSGKTTVMKYNGSAWVSVGSAGFSADQADNTSLAFAPDGTPYLGYRDWGNSYKATVMKYNGSAWVNVGSAGFSAGQANYTSLAFAPDGTPYLGYQDWGNSGRATVMKYNGSAWVNVGNAGFSANGVYFSRLAFAPDGTPYLGYMDAGNGYKATVMRLSSKPTATTGAASAVSESGATMNGTANAYNDQATVSFEYGTTASYGSSVTATESPATGASDTAVSKAISGLAAGTTYHYRVVATNTAGTVNGSDQTFTTLVVYSVTYNGNGNSGGSAPVDSSSPYLPGSSVTLPDAGTLTRAGYTFIGWNTLANGSGTTYQPAATFTIAADTTFYAKWVANGVCGSSSGAPFTVAPASSLCSYGTPSAVSGSGPWRWTCTGDIGGTTASCSAYLPGTLLLPKTGQTACTDTDGNDTPCTGTGQDGDKRAGALQTDPLFTDNGDDTITDKVYKMTWWKDAGTNGTPVQTGIAGVPVSRFTDNANGTITDNLTGLVWLKKGDCFSSIDWATALNSANSLVGDNSRCSLNDGSAAGDWRLPNINELASVATNWAGATPAEWLNTQGFTAVSDYYWSSSSYSSDAGNAWSVVMADGKVYAYSKSSTINAWLVRSGEAGSLGTLTVSKSGSGTGSVSSALAGISCGATCSASFAKGQFVTLTATADSGSGFAGWSGCDSSTANQCTVSVTGAKRVTATFKPTYTVSYKGNGNDGGTAPVDGSSPYLSDSIVTVSDAGTLTRTGYTFAGWSTDVNGSGISYAAAATFAIAANTTLYAKWTINSYPVNPQSTTGGVISPATVQSVEFGKTATFTISAQRGYSILAVSGCNGTLNGTIYTTGAITDSCTVLVVALKHGTGDDPVIAAALKAFQAYSGTVVLTPEEIIKYDVAPVAEDGVPQGDGVVDLADVIMLLRRSVGIGSW